MAGRWQITTENVLPIIDTGSNLDAMIARRVFGWKDWRIETPSRTPGETAFSFDALVPPEFDGSYLQHLNMIIPNYSTKIEAAWLVWGWIERGLPAGTTAALIRADGLPTVRLTEIEYDIDGGMLSIKNGVIIGDAIKDLRSRNTTGHSYEHAICLAALEIIEARGG